MTRKLAPLWILALTACFATSFSHSAAQAEVTIEKTSQGLEVKVDGKLFTRYLTNSGPKPILYPIIGPTGKSMTRNYPMKPEKIENERQDHPHHRSFWFTHGSVGGVDFWSETEGHGSIKQQKLVKASSGPQATIVTVNDWLSPDGKKICEDERTLTFGADKKNRWIDFDVVVKATEGDVTFGDTKEGAFGVRVAGTMKVDAKLGGEIVNSAGQKDKAAWGKPAKWVDYHGPVDDETVGVAILNHPTSYGYPNHWHVRTYGLFTANPFGLHNFHGKPIEEVNGAHTIPKGKTMVLRYRVLLHAGDQAAG